MWGGVLPGLLLGAMLVGLAACAPFGVAPPPPRPALATTTAAASVAGATPATLPSNLNVDPGRVAVLWIPDGAKFGGPSVQGQPTGGVMASGTMPVGSFKLSSAAQVAIIFGCTSPANVQSTFEIGVDGQSSRVTCTPNGATMNRFQTTFTAADVGRTLAVTATITTNGPTPRWFALVEQPK
jgi:hypothetical protein